MTCDALVSLETTNDRNKTMRSDSMDTQVLCLSGSVRILPVTPIPTPMLPVDLGERDDAQVVERWTTGQGGQSPGAVQHQRNQCGFSYGAYAVYVCDHEQF
jgi:hypothetical protein